MNRRNALESIGELSGYPHHNGAAHAVTHGTNARLVCHGMSVHKLQHGLCVCLTGLSVQSGHVSEHHFHGLGRALFEVKVSAASIVEVG